MTRKGLSNGRSIPVRPVRDPEMIMSKIRNRTAAESFRTAVRKGQKLQREGARIAKARELAGFLLEEMQCLEPQVPLKKGGMRIVEEFKRAIREGDGSPHSHLLATELLEVVAWERMNDPNVGRASVELLQLITWISQGLNCFEWIDPLDDREAVDGEDRRSEKPIDPPSIDRVLDMILMLAPRLATLVRAEDCDRREKLELTWKGRQRFGRPLAVMIKYSGHDNYTSHGPVWEK